MNFDIPKKPKLKLKTAMPDQRQIAVMPLRALKDKTLRNGAIRVLGLVCSYANRAGITWVGQERLARDLGVTRSAITQYITILKKKNYVEILNKGRKLNFTSTMRVVYNEKLCAEDAIAVAASTEDLRSPMMIRDEEMEMTKKVPKTSAKAVKTIREYIDTKQSNQGIGEATVTYNSKLEIVSLIYGKVYKEEKVINDLDLKAIEIAESIGLTNQQFAHDLELWLRARPARPDSIIEYGRGL
jgi:hypothetical protein